MSHNFPKGQIKGSLSAWQSSLASRAWCRTVSGRECQGYFYKQLQRYQQCGAGAEIPIFADDISWTRVPANESTCQQAQEGRRKQRPMVIKQVTASDLGRHRGWGPRLWLSQPGAGQRRRAWELGAGWLWKGTAALPRWKGWWDEGPDGEEMDGSVEPSWSVIPLPLLNLKSVWRIWPSLQTPEIAKRMTFLSSKLQSGLRWAAYNRATHFKAVVVLVVVLSQEVTRLCLVSSNPSSYLSELLASGNWTSPFVPQFLPL